MIHDVVIVGAGPVGLLLACELRLGGASVLILERASDPSSPLKVAPFGVRGLSGATIEALDRRGLLADVQAAGPAIEATDSRHRQTGHFAGIPLEEAKIDTARWAHRRPGHTGTLVATTMEQLETVLAARADTAGARLVRGVAIDGIVQSDDGVVARAGERSFRARYLVGCDGGRSVVRKAGGFDFVGTEPMFTGYSVQVDLGDQQSLPLGRHYTPHGMFVQSQPGTIAMVDFDGGAFHRSGPISAEHVQDVLRRVTGVGVEVVALRIATTWTDRAQQATSYGRGRVYLAGDAAHVHSPLGGQGLNLGLGDAMNLGWKLGAVSRGARSPELLETYCSERHPVGAAVLDWSRAQVALMDPGPQARALMGIMRDLIGTRDGATYVAERASGVSLRYDLGGRHPLIGLSAPDFDLVDGTRLDVLLRDGMAVLLNFVRSPELRSIRRRSSVLYFEGEAGEHCGLSAVLVRPDGVVAWASDDEQPSAADATAALTQWS